MVEISIHYETLEINYMFVSGIYVLVQPYMMGMAEVIKPVQPFDKGPTKLSHVIVTMPPLVFISTCCILG